MTDIDEEDSCLIIKIQTCYLENFNDGSQNKIFFLLLYKSRIGRMLYDFGIQRSYKSKDNDDPFVKYSVHIDYSDEFFQASIFHNSCILLRWILEETKVYSRFFRVETRREKVTFVGLTFEAFEH